MKQEGQTTSHKDDEQNNPWSNNLFDECFNDNKPHGINDKFYEWWSTDVCTWVFV